MSHSPKREGPELDTQLATILTGAGVAGVFCVLFVIGLVFPRQVVTDLKTENAELKAQNVAERERGDAAVATMQSSRDVIAALQAGLRMGAGLGDPPVPRETVP